MLLSSGESPPETFDTGVLWPSIVVWLYSDA